ncbi:MAG: hypothetical protein E7375_04105 [Clostridiales bacterium]|nr:hypothetical protein [Clostridiales bacterium]
MSDKKTTTKTTETKQTRTWSSTKVLDCVAYFAIMCIAVALIFRLIFKESMPQVAGYFQGIGECLAYIVCMWLGFYWTRRKKNIWWFICWLVATVVITVIYIFAII